MSLVPYNKYDWEYPFEAMEREILNDGFLERTPTKLLTRRRSLVTSEFYNSWNSLYRPWNRFYRSWDNLTKPFGDWSSTLGYLSVDDIGTNVVSDKDKFQVTLDVQHFKPYDIKVRVVERDVVVEGDHGEKWEKRGYVKRQFHRRFALPDGCLSGTVRSTLSSDGILTITAPKVLPLPSIGERIVPIVQTGYLGKTYYG